MPKDPELDNAAQYPQDSLLGQQNGSPEQSDVPVAPPEVQHAEVKEPTYSEGGLRIPSEYKDSPTDEQSEEIERLVGAGLGTIDAKRRVLGDKFIESELPPNINAPQKGKSVKIDRRKLGPNQKNRADGDKRVEAVYGSPGEIL